MKVVSSILNGKDIPDRFGKRGTESDKNGIPKRSVPFEVVDAPLGTVSYAIILEDKDSVPVCGFVWIHWLAANIKRTSIAENESIRAKDFIQGTNSWMGSVGKEGAYGYGGMTPPDATHKYELHVFALDTEVDLSDGFFLNELYRAMEGHVLGTDTVYGYYVN